MATYAHDSSLEQEASPDDIKHMMSQKAHEMFQLCDKEEKGFITKRDMLRLQCELPLSAEQLEDVFDSLDDDANGYLTLEEFTGGFGTFLGLAPKQDASQADDNTSSEKIYENRRDDPEMDGDHFEELLDNLDAKEVFDDMHAIKAVWSKLRRDEPELLGNFEEFLSRMSGEMKRTQTDFQSLEHALRNKSSAHDEEVRKLYEEMEQQIKLEKERILNEEKSRERQVREELERELREKDRQMQEMLLKHQDMEDRLQHLNLQDSETKNENEKLEKERDRLENMLDHSQQHLESSRGHINELKSKQRHDKRDRAMAALQISEGIALERESLVKQLEMLRDMNRKLRDERDESDLRRVRLGPAPAQPPPHSGHDPVAHDNNAINYDSQNYNVTPRYHQSLRYYGTTAARPMFTAGSLPYANPAHFPVNHPAASVVNRFPVGYYMPRVISPRYRQMTSNVMNANGQNQSSAVMTSNAAAAAVAIVTSKPVIKSSISGS